MCEWHRGASPHKSSPRTAAELPNQRESGPGPQWCPVLRSELPAMHLAIAGLLVYKSIRYFLSVNCKFETRSLSQPVTRPKHRLMLG